MQALSFEEWRKLSIKDNEEKSDNALIKDYDDYLDKFDEQTEECYGKVRIV